MGDRSSATAWWESEQRLAAKTPKFPVKAALVTGCKSRDNIGALLLSASFA
jgi:hypothetical protein